MFNSKSIQLSETRHATVNESYKCIRHDTELTITVGDAAWRTNMGVDSLQIT